MFLVFAIVHNHAKDVGTDTANQLFLQEWQDIILTSLLNQ